MEYKPISGAVKAAKHFLAEPARVPAARKLIKFAGNLMKNLSVVTSGGHSNEGAEKFGQGSPHSREGL